MQVTVTIEHTDLYGGTWLLPKPSCNPKWNDGFIDFFMCNTLKEAKEIVERMGGSKVRRLAAGFYQAEVPPQRKGYMQ